MIITRIGLQMIENVCKTQTKVAPVRYGVLQWLNFHTEMKVRMFKIVQIRRVEQLQNGIVPHRRKFGGLEICIGVKNVPTFVRSLTPLQRFEVRNFLSLPTHDDSIVSMTPEAKVECLLAKKMKQRPGVCNDRRRIGVNTFVHYCGQTHKNRKRTILEFNQTLYALEQEIRLCFKCVLPKWLLQALARSTLAVFKFGLQATSLSGEKRKIGNVCQRLLVSKIKLANHIPLD